MIILCSASLCNVNFRSGDIFMHTITHSQWNRAYTGNLSAEPLDNMTSNGVERCLMLQDNKEAKFKGCCKTKIMAVCTVWWQEARNIQSPLHPINYSCSVAKTVTGFFIFFSSLYCYHHELPAAISSTRTVLCSTSSRLSRWLCSSTTRWRILSTYVSLYISLYDVPEGWFLHHTMNAALLLKR